MIIFQWSLTTNQISCLRAVRMWHDAETRLGREPDQDIDNIFLGGDNNNFHQGCQRLFREGYIIRRDVPKTDGRKWSGKTRPKLEITEKGRLVLDLVTLELERHATSLAIETKRVRKLRGA